MAINTNQEAAASLGVDTMRMKLKAGFIAAFFTAIGGTFFVQMLAVVDPSRVLGYDLSAQIMVYAIIGGRGTLWGPVVAALILSPLSDLLRSSFGANIPGLNLIIYGLALMFIVYYLPKGIWPPVSRFLNRLFSTKTGTDQKASARKKADTDAVEK
jgi:branched-chain amino acid transport system permease protein